MLIDTHAHLSFPQFEGDLSEVLERARQAGVTRIVNVGTQLASSRAAIDLAERETGVFASVGFHPADSAKADAISLGELEILLKHPKVVAVGETGLDFYRDYAPRDVQEDAFRAHIRLAREAGLPLIIHSRAAEARVLEVLAEEGASDVGGVLHCFDGSLDQAHRAVNLNFHLGFGGMVTYKNSASLKVALCVPSRRLLLETDSPFLSPVPVRGKRNEPAHVRHVAECLAVRGEMDLDALCRQTTENAMALLGLDRA